MSMEQQIQQDIKAAMLAKEKTRLESLRAIKAAITLAKTADGSESIADEAVVKIIQKLVKQRKETAEIYKQQNREELAAQELAEAAAMEVYLPKQLSEEELEAELAEAEKKPRERRITEREAGSIAEAALKLNGVFEAAQAAADQYLENIRTLASSGCDNPVDGGSSDES